MSKINACNDNKQHWFFFKIKVELIYNIMFVSGVQQSDSVMYTNIYVSHTQKNPKLYTIFKDISIIYQTISAMV